jgi:MFS family permease
MERSLDLAEAMEARGFSRTPPGAARLRPIVAQTGIASGLGLILVGATLPAILPRDATWPGWVVIAAGAGVLTATLWAMGRGMRRERYRRGIWRERDTYLAALSIGIAAFLIAYRLLAASALLYYPFPRIHWPEFDPLVALVLAALSGPVIFLSVEDKVARGGAMNRAIPAHPASREHRK